MLSNSLGHDRDSVDFKDSHKSKKAFSEDGSDSNSRRSYRRKYKKKYHDGFSDEEEDFDIQKFKDEKEKFMKQRSNVPVDASSKAKDDQLRQ